MTSAPARRPLAVALALLVPALLAPALAAQDDPGDVASLVSLGAGSGGFPGTLDPGDAFGASMAFIGDLDGDGVEDLAVGAPGDDDGGPDRGAVWICFMNGDGTVDSAQKISDTAGGLSIGILDGMSLGRSVIGLGDIDLDGVEDIMICLDENNLFEQEARAYTLLLNTDGTVKSAVDSSPVGGPGFQDGFGTSLANMGDLDGNGVVDVAVGTPFDVAFPTGAVYILYLDVGGELITWNVLASGSVPGLEFGEEFGGAVANVGDLDGNGINDLAVGSPFRDYDDGKVFIPAVGAVWILFLESKGPVFVLDSQRIDLDTGGFGGSLVGGDRFGSALALVGDLDDDGNPDLAVGAPGDDDITPSAAVGEIDTGAVWNLFLQPDGTVLGEQKISDTAGGLPVFLSFGAEFGTGLASNGTTALLAGAPGQTSGGSAFNMLLASAGGGGDEEQPYEGAITTLAGRPGRSSLVVLPPDPELPPPPDFIGTPVIVVPKSDGDLMRVEGVDGTASSSSNFTDEGAYPTGDMPAQASTGNFDSLISGFVGGTGLTDRSDVAVANFGSDSVSLFVGNPDGTFTPQPDTPLFVDVMPVAIQTGDFDNDALDDVAVAGAAGVTVMLGDGMGGFTTQTFTPVADLTDLALEFVDDDLFLDVVTTSGTVAGGPGLESGFATVLLGNGDGTLTNAGTFSTGQALASVLLGELDPTPGVDALLTTHQFDAGPGGIPQGRVDLWVGDGTGGFTLSGVFPGHVVPDVGGIHPTYGALGDVDGDLLTDAVYTSAPSLAFPFSSFADQHPPLVVTVLVNDGAGGFDVTEIGTAYSGKGVSAILEDFTDPGDDLFDVVLVWYEDVNAGGGGGTDDQTFLALLEGTGDDEVFEDSTGNQYGTGDEPGDGSLGNVDEPADGVDTLDLVVPNRGDNSLTILYGVGDGTFVPGPVVTGVDDTVPPGPDWVGGPTEVRFGGAGVEQGLVQGFPLVVLNRWEDRGDTPDPTILASLSVFAHDATAGFVKVQQVPLPRGGEFAQLDLTDDLVSDLVVTQREGPGGPDGVLLFPGLGPGAPGFGTAPIATQVPPGTRLAGGMHVTDVVGSALPDIVTSGVDIGTGEGLLLVFENAGGVLLPPAVSPLGATWQSLRSLVMGDLDGDELLDVALGEEDGRLFLATGQPDGRFVAAKVPPALAGIGGGALALREISGDGQLDLVACSDLGADGLGQAYVRTARGDAGSLGAPQTVAGLASVDADGRALAPLLGDLDGDGTLEIVLVHGPSNSLSVFPNAFDTFESYGTAKAGSGGVVPTLTADGYSVAGSKPAFRIEGGVGGSVALVQLGTGRTDLLFPAVETVFNQVVVPLSGTSGTPGVGSYAFGALLPGDPSFLGLEFTLQAAIQDPGVFGPAPFGFSITRGLAFTIVP